MKQGTKQSNDIKDETLASLQSAEVCKRTIRIRKFPNVADNCRDMTEKEIRQKAEESILVRVFDDGSYT
ncbi:hypothetical protein DPMN_180736 [Dreissena polymorpha]|uniref:Uncharacterized protein n=1 Tax=Dreissena polymorpha TaxID=45954 RepID=A0A9D4DEV5_DREPO|nr:hypothetical protein DPMN_180736 [Dreissena polymorpha]